MKLIIAEKRQLAEAIAKAIDGKEESRDGTIVKGEYTLVWTFGHLLTLKEPHDYDETMKKWALTNLPIYFKDWQTKPKADEPAHHSYPAKRVSQIAGLISQADIVIHAGDPDDEGQLLVDEVLRYVHCNKPVYRLDVNDLTEKALRKALKSMKPNQEFENLGWAAYARSVSDITFGINMTRFFSLNNNAVLPIGRVQTPTLGLVVARDLLIENHVKTVYYEILADLKIGDTIVHCKYEPQKDDPNLTDGRILSKSYAKTRADMLRNETFSNVKISQTEVAEQPPLPLDLVELQTQAGRRFKYSPQEVMEITQSLRDNYNAITYNRSECRYLHEGQFDDVPSTMNTVIKNIGFKPKELDITIKSRAFDDKKTEGAAHTAIIPQDTSADLSKMSQREKDVYLIIVKYYMAQFLPDAKKKRMKLEVPLPDGGKLTASSTSILSPGYLSIFRNDDIVKDEKTELDALKPGTHKGTVIDVKTEEKETKPPAKYTQTSLNKDMAHVAKYVEDPEVKKLLIAKDKDKDGANGSIGTGATRASIIQGLIDRGYMTEDSKKHLTSTPMARALLDILPEEAKKPDLTAHWWAIQEDIRSGDASYEALTMNVLKMVNEFIHRKYPPIDPKFLPKKSGAAGGGEVVGKCPRCGKPVEENKMGFSCTDWKGKQKGEPRCGFTIWKQPLGKTFEKIHFTKTDAKAFLAGKKVHKKNLISKTGKTFEADLTMVDEQVGADYRTHYDFSFDNTKRKGAK